ncbi:hypothetical protein [Actinokineospora iranica]|uniref:Uncharacterized protein n=1 Tax=Actinokineospora iranica TaxID=1271860 RepID=A0A1G6P8Y0_9PSEU|nr:hypothetical protein [Actinokineospora iranica]SDC75877.1 hypothetical protein SAMN05216174_104147 [Actinokineospora iranica]
MVTPDPEQVDLAANLARLAARLDEVAHTITQTAKKARVYASGVVIGWATREQADQLAELFEEAARQVRLLRPDDTSGTVITGTPQEQDQ